MGEVEARLQELGLILPSAIQVSARLPFEMAVIRGTRVLLSGHAPQAPDGTVAGPLGKVGADLTVEEAYQSARLVGLALIGSLQRAIGDLDRVAGWTRVFGMVNSAPGFIAHPAVINGFSDLVLDVFGPQVGAHSRSAVGMAELPFNIPVEIEAEVELKA